MKFVCLLFCLYVLYLVSMPCKDGDGCTNDFCTEQVNHHHHSGDQDHPDDCSPFCVCSCCSVTVLLSTFHFDPAPYFIPVVTRFILKEGQSVPYLHPIWEPPKSMI